MTRGRTGARGAGRGFRSGARGAGWVHQHALCDGPPAPPSPPARPLALVAVARAGGRWGITTRGGSTGNEPAAGGRGRRVPSGVGASARPVRRAPCASEPACAPTRPCGRHTLCRTPATDCWVPSNKDDGPGCWRGQKAIINLHCSSAGALHRAANTWYWSGSSSHDSIQCSESSVTLQVSHWVVVLASTFPTLHRIRRVG